MVGSGGPARGGRRGGVREELEALLALRQIPGLGDRRIRELVEARGSAAGALVAARAQEELGLEAGKTGPPLTLEELDLSCMEVLPLTHPRYPPFLLELTDPPPILFLRGRRELLEAPSVAVVGARKATEAGRRTAEALGRVLAGAGITVVSGMARGIDGAAHRGALEAGGDTVAVLASGLRRAYPSVNRGLQREVGDRGLLVSEFLPRENPLAHHFPRRNRIIAALAGAVVVVEAGERSGAFITVDHGLDLGKEILAFPGAVENPQARGTNLLIRDGARLLTSPQAILEELPNVVRDASAGRSNGSPPPAHDEGGAGLPPGLRPLLDALSTDPLPLDVLARAAALPVPEAVAGLSTLELIGRAHRCPGMRFRRG